MALTPSEEAMHLEVIILRTFKAKTEEERYICKQALQTFVEQHQAYILDVLNQHLATKAKE